MFIASGSALQRASDADVSGEFIDNFNVYVQGGTLYGGVTFRLATTGSVTLGTTALSFVRSAFGAKTELIANRGVAGGIPSLTNPGAKLTHTQLGGEATHTATAAANQITPTQTTMIVAGSGGAVTMTSGDPRITGCTTAAAAGQLLILKGGHAANTLTMPTGQGVQLCGNTGSIIFGLNSGKAIFECSGTVWEQIGCPTLQAAANVGKDIDGATSSGTAVRVGDIAGGNYTRFYNNTSEGMCSGTPCATTDIRKSSRHRLWQ